MQKHEMIKSMAMKKCAATGVLQNWVVEIKQSRIKKAARKMMMKRAKEAKEAAKLEKEMEAAAAIVAAEAAREAEIARLEAEKEAATKRVPEDFATIQQALDALPPEGRLTLAPGNYNEQLTIEKPVSITGVQHCDNPTEGDETQDRTMTQIRWNDGHTLTIASENVKLSGVRITNNLPEDKEEDKKPDSPGATSAVRAASPVSKPTRKRSVALMVISGDIVVDDCDISSECGAGMCVLHMGSSAALSNSQISECTMSGLLVGDGASVTVENSIITTNLNNGVTVQAAQVLISNSKIEASRKDGILATAGSEAVVEDCLITKNKKAGVNIQEGSKAQFTRNVVTRNKDGINVLAIEGGIPGASAILENNQLGGNRQDNLYIDESCQELSHVAVDNVGTKAGT